MSTMTDYYNLHLKVDVLLFACVFQNYKKESRYFFELDPSHYLSTPDYSRDAMLRFKIC